MTGLAGCIIMNVSNHDELRIGRMAEKQGGEGKRPHPDAGHARFICAANDLDPAKIVQIDPASRKG